jgi:hypothetical protein
VKWLQKNTGSYLHIFQPSTHFTVPSAPLNNYVSLVFSLSPSVYFYTPSSYTTHKVTLPTAYPAIRSLFSIVSHLLPVKRTHSLLSHPLPPPVTTVFLTLLYDYSLSWLSTLRRNAGSNTTNFMACLNIRMIHYTMEGIVGYEI